MAALAVFKQRNPGIKTLVSVGGGSGSRPFPALAADPEARSKLASELVEFCYKHSFDGVDSECVPFGAAYWPWMAADREPVLLVDWEHPMTAENGVNFLSLLQDLRQAMPDGHILSTALPIGEYCLKNIDLVRLGNTVNFLNLMGYDFHGAWTKTSGHHAQLHSPDPQASHDHTCPPGKSCARGVDYVLSQGFPPHKLLLGIAAYARFFPSARGPGGESTDAGEMEYNEMPEEWLIQAEVDDAVGAASIVDDQEGGKGFVSFDVPQTVGMKARYVKEKTLGGLFYWTAAGDREDGWSLAAAGWHELQHDEGGQSDAGPNYTVESRAPMQGLGNRMHRS